MKNIKNVRGVINDVTVGLISLAIIIGNILYDTEIRWLSIIFFGLCLVLLLLKYMYPHKRIFNPDGVETEGEKRNIFFNSNGIFNYHIDGFSIKGYNDDIPLKWEDIIEIIAYKEDHLYTDQIYFSVLHKENKQGFTIHESTEGWHQFTLAIQRNLKIDNEWFKKVAHPAFERNETIIYKKQMAN